MFLQKKASEYTLWEKMTRFQDWVLQVAIDKEAEERKVVCPECGEETDSQGAKAGLKCSRCSYPHGD